MDEETEEKIFFVDSITPKDEFHVEEDSLRNEMEGETYLSRIKKGQERLRKNF